MRLGVAVKENFSYISNIYFFEKEKNSHEAKMIHLGRVRGCDASSKWLPKNTAEV